MYCFSNLGRFAPCLAPLLLAGALTAGCSPAGSGEQRETPAQPHDAGASGHASGHAAAAGGHPQPVAASRSANDKDLGWSRLQNGHEHAGETPKRWEELPAEVRARLTHQLALTRRLLDKFKTVADAEAAGYRRRGPHSPGMGVHYSGGGIANTSGTLSDEEILRPTHLIFDGMEKTSRLAGFMYVSGFDRRRGPLEGFAGPYDVWHGHTGICFKMLPNGEKDSFGADGSIGREECEKLGAQYQDAQTAMVHVWTVPGFKSSLGVFSGLNPALKCPDGTYYTDGPAKACRKP